MYIEKLYPFKGFEDKYLISRSGKVYGTKMKRMVKIQSPTGKATLHHVMLHDKKRSKSFNLQKAIWINFPDMLPNGFYPMFGHEDSYAISRSGEILSYGRGRIIKPHTTKTSPYLYCTLKGKGKRHFSVHRLVAETFIPNPNNLPEVDHIDRNPLNNNVENLRWVTRKENLENTEVGFTRNYAPCKLFYRDKLIGIFSSIRSASHYAEKNYGASVSSLIKHYRSRGCKIIKCND